ncbi:decarboxylating cobalt-precorrin-6B (C(15))-methyltransferase [Xenorhabdus nematophila]|uniref:Cobalt-precorrin-6Y C(15)-methyltransferase [decarboxylating] n=1 Tax=Xenorhabdus nematophila (strain ATCC 19061 / DSM 3370 / CCUG 14189 / LMG 1036 / NCIMB 9965 / AN6) TaxID=406817 RepID=D3V927_XENNA|nr:decarboxylating cobalt-precorrin-6B (C(15))-methyltransferase [Xenorhabdus nematophila]CEE93988.1 putative cobalt-precorrin-6Y C(15)-methyltransferase (decarboxylating) [Xenorhabdus nematophila str. Anatoliense]CEF30763.1 putative cobalt-precorrin-6Y C(15)-methyltransferase (decarboxylating) [Xenorhabdus nematophila str. Websteri]AYA40819.1 decarboxylating cobalt-precorrin-6B (C(15))-methyltransferase [Xenorhabdus nematophila]KHD28624.1 cobalt-precorrin-6Y C(15)-methyltransferase [Xenorhabdu
MKDELFLRGHRIPMTKEAVRALAIERLALAKARHLIDVGAGTGSVSIEAALRYPTLDVLAIEHKEEALSLIAENIRHFGCHTVRIQSATAPVPLDNPADAIFIGGTGGYLTEMIDWALSHLNQGGRLVMTFILLENFMQALSHLRACQVASLDGREIQVGELTALGQGHYFKPNNPTYLISCQKGVGQEVHWQEERDDV